ncbi:MAG: BPL-N domain-containing protein [Methanothrix sp.]|jgi:glutamine amidotransferase-like uncharacterized protein|nr:BPL-N domain-containing protein [Methanothrix sp.]
MPKDNGDEPLSPGSYLIALDKNESCKGNQVNVAAFSIINQLLEEGVPVNWTIEDFQAEGQSYPAGTFLIKAPFRTRRGISWNAVMSWLEDKGKQAGINEIDKSLEIVTVKSKKLVAPRIALYYDSTTYDNALMHYLTFRCMGFKVTLTHAQDLLKDESDPDSVLARSNVFVMPGGSMHFSSFSTQKEAARAIENLRNFVCNGGGYIGVCAGATEALIGSPHPYLNLVDASYRAEWFMPREPAEVDWEWRTLMGPLLLEIAEQKHPVVFGYGHNTVLPGYGPRVAVEYFGGPSMFNIGSSVTVLARYSAPIHQILCKRVQDIWGSAAIVSSRFGSGKVILFGPHPEWPGPCHRMYAQALYYVACKPKPSNLERICSQDHFGKPAPDSISTQRVQSIVQTASEAGSVLENCMKMCNSMVELGAGERSNPLSIWYDKTLLTFTEELMDQMSEIARHARVFQQEDGRLSCMASCFCDNPRTVQWIAYSRSLIEQFFAYAENLPPASHRTADSLPCDPQKFSDLLPAIMHVEDEIRKVDMPCIVKYARLFHHYELLRTCCIACRTEENKRAMDEMYLKITSLHPPGPLYQAMNTLRHTLDVMQYKIEAHLLNLLTLADSVGEVISMTDYALAKDADHAD